MKLLVLFAVLGVAVCEGTEDRPAWLNENTFGQYQDAWQSIQGDENSRYYLYQSTYKTDKVWGDDFICVSVKATTVHKEDESIDAEIKYKNKDKPDEFQTSAEKVTAIKMHGYNKKNGIKYEAKKGAEEFTFNDTLAFTDPNCDIFYTESKDYELWVNQNSVKKVPACCQFMFKLFAGNKNIHNIYQDDCDPEAKSA
uniref:Lipocalin n=1 Tax=Rhipicephalus zambeziensis TaxID=60191 RepID=A0A224YBY4_9ACAR